MMEMKATHKNLQTYTNVKIILYKKAPSRKEYGKVVHKETATIKHQIPL